MAPRGNRECPKLEIGPRWHSTGSPTCAVLDEKFCSSMVQRSSVPAGTISSLEAARAPTTEAHRTRVISRDFPAMVGLLVDTSCRSLGIEEVGMRGTAETPGDGRGLVEAYAIFAGTSTAEREHCRKNERMETGYRA